MTDVDTRDTQAEGLPETYEYVEEVVEYKDTRLVRLLLALILVLLALLLAFLTYRVYSAQMGHTARGAKSVKGGMTWIRSIYGWGTGSDQQLIAPNTVGIGPDGLIWTNSNNRVAVAFEPDGSFDRILQSKPMIPGEATATAIQGSEQQTPTVQAVFTLDIDGDNNLYIGDNAQGAIMQFTPEASLKQGWSVPYVNKIATNDSRVVALTEGSVGVFDIETGKPYFNFGSRGTGEMQFDNPFGAHIDDQNYVYVADTQNRRVRKFDPRGNLVWDAGKVPDRSDPNTMDARKASLSDLFQLPTGVTTDANGRVLVTDAFNFQIVVLDGKTGKKIAAYGDYGQEDGSFNNPSAIVYDAKRDYFVVADTANNRLQIVRIPGSSKAAGVAAVRRAFDRPIWICCLPFLVLLLAAVIVSVSRRGRDQDQQGASEPA